MRIESLDDSDVLIHCLLGIAVRLEAAHALKELCHKAAPFLPTTWPAEALIVSCEAALSVPVELPKEEEMQVQVVVVQGLASVLAVLPPADAERGLIRLTFGATSTIKEIATMGNVILSNGAKTLVTKFW